jgi:serine acetyltransferase
MKHNLKRLINALRRDPQGRILWTVDSYLQDMTSYIDTAICQIATHFWGVHLGHSCQFYGVTHFRRHPESTITIGVKCQFRSAFCSNLVGMNRPCAISTHRKMAVIQIGDDAGFSATSITAANKVIIGNNVLCGANVIITDFDWHEITPLNRRKGMGDSAPIIIGNNVWLGMNSTVLKDVEIGENTVIGANSVVTSSIPANVIAAGVPAKVIRSI